MSEWQGCSYQPITSVSSLKARVKAEHVTVPTMDIDFSLYLVTARNILPSGKKYLESLEESLQGGVTVVQIREKEAETAEFLEIAKQSKTLCDRYNVPLLINDRIDIALAVQAHGVHLGQTDMPIKLARQLLPQGFVIGVSCNTVDDVKRAILDGADYVGIGSIWATNTKKLTNPILGVRGVGPLLAALDNTSIKAVAIGGIKTTNLQRTLHGAVSETGHILDGVAVISEIVGSSEPQLAAESLCKIIRQFRQCGSVNNTRYRDVDHLLNGVTDLMEGTRGLNPLVHQITNNVVATQSANLTLALGASPIMATAPQEMEDLSKICGALLVNIGTLTDATAEGMKAAGFFANTNGKPIVFDPVGVGASSFRQAAVRGLLDYWQASVIKGNAGELAALAGSLEVSSKGVDSVGIGFKNPVAFVKKIAKTERCVVVLTGPTDYVSDGKIVVELKNGVSMLGEITGSGCMLGSAIASYCATAVAKSESSSRSFVGDGTLLASVAGVLVLTIAAELAVERPDVRGAGTFLPALIDSIHSLRSEDIKKRAEVMVHLD